MSIYKEADRKEGKELVRPFMEHDELSEADDEDEAERDPTCHQFDYAFGEKELEFVEKQWGNSENFLLLFGPKSYNDEDVEEGKSTVKALMAEDD
jgi:hypothetical protein